MARIIKFPVLIPASTYSLQLVAADGSFVNATPTAATGSGNLRSCTISETAAAGFYSCLAYCDGDLAWPDAMVQLTSDQSETLWINNHQQNLNATVTSRGSAASLDDAQDAIEALDDRFDEQDATLVDVQEDLAAISAQVAGVAVAAATAVWNFLTADITPAIGSFGNWVLGLARPSDLVVSPTTAADVDRGSGTAITAYVGETSPITVTDVNDAQGSPVDISGRTLRLVIEDSCEVDVQVVEDGEIDISGDDNNAFSWTPTLAVTGDVQMLKWSLRDAGNGDFVLALGTLNVKFAAMEDAE